MEEKQSPSPNVRLESSLSDLILKSSSTKIRRPPNAFMLFARDHRKTVAKQYSDLNNKEISSILGKIWRNTAENIKEKYHAEAKMLGALHKTRFPGYVYSPREARLQKMNKKKKRDVAMNDASNTNAETLRTVLKNSEGKSSSVEKDLKNDASCDSKCSPEYVPNNPGYFTQQSPDMPNERMEEGNEEVQPPNEPHQEKTLVDVDQIRTHSEMGLRRPMTSESGGFYSRTPLDPRFRPYGIRDGVSPQLLEHNQHSYSTPRPFYNASGYFPAPVKSFCCSPPTYSNSVPRAYRPPYHPYYGSSLMDQHYYQERDFIYEEKPFPYPTAYHTPELYKPRFRYFDKNIAPYPRNPSFGYYTQLNDDWDYSRRNQNEFAIENPEPYPYFSRSRLNETNLPYLYPGNFRNDDGAYFQNKNFTPSLQTTDYLPYQSKSEAEAQGIPNSSHIRGETDTLNIVENSFQNQEYPCTNLTEDKDKISAAYHFQKNKHPFDSMNNNINKEYSSDYYLNKEQTQSANISRSEAPLDIENTPKIDTSQCILANNVQNLNYPNSFEMLTPNVEPYSLSKVELIAPYLKSAAGMNLPTTNDEIQRMHEISKSIHDSSQNKEKIEYIKKSPGTTNEQTDFTIEGKIFTQRDVENRQHIGSANIISSYDIQMLRKNFNVVASNNLDITPNSNQENNTILSSHQLSIPVLKVDANSPDSSIARVTTEESEINGTKFYVSNNFYSTDALLDKNLVSSQTHQNSSPHTNVYTEEEVNTSDNYSKNLQESFRNKDSDYSATHLNNNGVRLVKQDLPKVYYEQIDGSYQIQDKLPGFNTLIPNTQRLVSRSNLASDHEKEVDSNCSISPVVIIEKIDN